MLLASHTFVDKYQLISFYSLDSRQSSQIGFNNYSSTEKYIIFFFLLNFCFIEYLNLPSYITEEKHKFANIFTSVRLFFFDESK